MATIKDIAEKLGIAPSTVSKGLNGANDISSELQQLVLDTAIEMGYKSKKMKKEENKSLCLLIKNMEYKKPDDFGYELILGFRQAALRDHWNVSIILADEFMQTEKYDNFMLRNGFLGGFLLGFTLQDPWMQQLTSTSIPTVLLDNYINNNDQVGSVATDSHEGIELAIKHLQELGHTRIGFMNGERFSDVSEQRRQAFLDSMASHNIQIDPDLIAYSHFNGSYVKEHIPHFIDHKATAIVCSSDLIAYNVIAEYQARGYRVPEDVSVVGFDDLASAESFTPPLTTIKQDRLNLGKDAYATLSWLLNGVSISKSFLRAKLIVRQSTASVNLDI